MIKVLSHLDPDTMIQGDKRIFRASDVEYIDITLIEKQQIVVRLKSQPKDEWNVMVSGFNALELVWLLKPGALEGKRIKFPKYSWFVHNMFAHPLMQIIALFGFTKAAIWVHDVTVPKPKRI